MKIHKHLLLFVSLLISSNAIAIEVTPSESKTKYFAKIVGIISPFLDYKVTGELSAKQAATINHYRVVYDNENRMKTISYFHGNYPSSDSYFYTHKVIYSYSPNNISRKYFDKYDQAASMWRHYYMDGNVHHEQFAVTDHGMELKLFDLSGERVKTGFNAYLFIKQTTPDGNFIQWQFDENNKPVVLTNYFPFEKALIATDKNGHLKDIFNLNYQTNAIENHSIAKFSHVEFDFDQYGNELGWRFADVQGNLVNRPSTIEDPGYAIWTYKFDWRERKYGKFHRFEISYFDENNATYCHSNGVCKIRYEEDSFGELVGQSFHKADGNLINDSNTGFAKVTIARDAKGRRIESRYYDDNGQLRTEGVAFSRFIYDKNDEVSKTDFNAKGQALNN